MRDIAPFGLRMPPELKERLDREAKINRRSLNAELVERLARSFDKCPPGPKARAESPGLPYVLPALTDAERQIVAIFRQMSPVKQLALISLFK